jgi:hypothetical protein
VADASEPVRAFFDAYALATASLAPQFLEAAYAESFMFVGPAGAMAVRRDDFLKIVPRRKAFFTAAGLAATEIAGLDETVLDAGHLLVKAHWTFRFEKEAGQPILEPGAATYVLRRQEDGRLSIVFQLDHQDLTKRVQELGLLPQQV